MCKGAIEQIVRVLSKDLGARGITVNAISPSAVDTPLFRAGKPPQMIKWIASLNPQNRIPVPDEISPIVAFLAREEAGWINGQIIGVNGVSHMFIQCAARPNGIVCRLSLYKTPNLNPTYSVRVFISFDDLFILQSHHTNVISARIPSFRCRTPLLACTFHLPRHCNTSYVTSMSGCFGYNTLAACYYEESSFANENVTKLWPGRNIFVLSIDVSLSRHSRLSTLPRAQDGDQSTYHSYIPIHLHPY